MIKSLSVLLGKLLFPIAALATSLVPAISQAVPFDFGGKAGFENFKWEEFDDDGSKLLEESGARFTISGFLSNSFKVNRGFIYGAEAKFYGGEVDYDGQTQDGVPAKSDTTYNGMMLEGEAGFRAGSINGGFGWDFIGRAGFDFWTREIDDTTDILGRSVRGGTEQYTILNLRFGTGPSWQAGRWKARFIAGIKYPFATNEFISEDDSGLDDDVDLEPKGRVSGYLNFSNHIQLTEKVYLRLDAFYDSYRFDKSDPETTSLNGVPVRVWQPESTQDNYGIQGGVSLNF